MKPPRTPFEYSSAEPEGAEDDEDEDELTTVEPFGALFQERSGAASKRSVDPLDMEEPTRVSEVPSIAPGEPLASAFEPLGFGKPPNEGSVTVQFPTDPAGDRSEPPPASLRSASRTLLATPDGAVAAREPARRSRVGLYALAALLVVGLAVGGVFLARHLTAKPPQAAYLFVRGEVQVLRADGVQALGSSVVADALDEAGSANAEELDATNVVAQDGDAGVAATEESEGGADIAADGGIEVAGLEDPGLPSVVDFGPAVRQGLASRRPSLRRCLDEHALAIRGEPALALELSIEADGRVTDSKVFPESLADSAVAACLTAVAQRTHFDEVHDSITVRVPLTARAAQGS